MDRQFDPVAMAASFTCAHAPDVPLLNLFAAPSPVSRSVDVGDAVFRNPKVLSCEPGLLACCAIRPDVGTGAHVSGRRRRAICRS